MTSRQLQILQLRAEGHPFKSIAHALAISEKTIWYHWTRIRAFFHSDDQVAIIRAAYHQGLITF